MEIVTVWVRYKGDEWMDAPMLAEAWTEYDIENNPQGWVEARDKAMNNSDVADSRVVNITVPYESIQGAFRDAKAAATNVSVDA